MAEVGKEWTRDGQAERGDVRARERERNERIEKEVRKEKCIK